jgi:hypothetical protein
MDGYAQILKDNIEFCKLEREAGDAYAELAELMKEVLENYGSWEKGHSREGFGKAVGESAMLTYLSFVLLPLSYGIAFDFLGGNLIASFMQMRALLEQLAKCYLADVEDINAEHDGFFQNRLRFIESSRSIAKSVGSLGSDALKLWGKLSDNWVHMMRLEKLVTAVSERGIPSYGTIVPIVYDAEDMPDIVEFTNCIKMLRALLKDTVERWNQTSRFAAHTEGK